jgi:hypothetical protein
LRLNPVGNQGEPWRQYHGRKVYTMGELIMYGGIAFAVIGGIIAAIQREQTRKAILETASNTRQR